MKVFIDSQQEEGAIDEQSKEAENLDSQLSLNFEDSKQEEQKFVKASVKESEQNTLVPTELNSNFLDNTYWRIGAEQEKTADIDALIAELEGF